MSSPRLTVGITCYREGEWLRECWESVLAQPEDRWMAVMVLDGGADQKTREVFDSINHPKLKKYASPINQGPYPTRNRAVEMTETEFHFYFDGDDLLVPESLSLCLETFDRGAAIVYGDYDIFGGKNVIAHFPRTFTWDDAAEIPTLSGPTAFRRDTWVQLGGFASELARGNGDYDFMIGALEADLPVLHCGGVINRTRYGHESVSTSYGRTYHQTHEIIVRRHPRFFEDERRRRRFLAQAYIHASRMNHRVGNHREAWRIWQQALTHAAWNDRDIWALATHLALPNSGVQWARAVSSRIKQL